MLLIGEKINGMFKNVREAVQNRDSRVIKDLALRQMKAGADYLDVNVGPSAPDPVTAMEWLVNAIQEAGDFPLALDSPKPEVIKAGLKLCKAKPLINSTTAEAAKLETLLPLAEEYRAKIIGLAMDEKGIPAEISARLELALQILASATEHDIPLDDIYIDPLILPVGVAQDTAPKVLEAISEIRKLSEPSPHLILGLSNVSQRCLNRDLINRTYLVMAMAVGLDAAILDVFDDELMESVSTAQMLLNRDIYCESFVEAFRRKKTKIY